MNLAVINTTDVVESSMFLKAKLKKNMVGDNYYLETLQLKVENELREQYKMTYGEAVAMYELYDRDDYTEALYEKIKELGLQ